jgi:hypothetical protein
MLMSTSQSCGWSPSWCSRVSMARAQGTPARRSAGPGTDPVVAGAAGDGRWHRGSLENLVTGWTAAASKRQWLIVGFVAYPAWPHAGSSSTHEAACSVGWWLMADAGLFWEKSTVGWLLMADFFWEKSTAGWWLISQTNRARLQRHADAYPECMIRGRVDPKAGPRTMICGHLRNFVTLCTPSVYRIWYRWRLGYDYAYQEVIN